MSFVEPGTDAPGSVTQPHPAGVVDTACASADCCGEHQFAGVLPGDPGVATDVID